MKRNKPMKRSAIRRSQKRLKRTPLRRMSAKTRAKQPARKACILAVRERSGGRCEIRTEHCTGRHDHTHEIIPRSAGGSITDPENCRAACWVCHAFIHLHPNKARALGFLK